MANQIAVLIDARLHNELVLRSRSSADVSGYIENAVASFLDSTEGDRSVWPLAYADAEEDDDLDAWEVTYGDARKGYRWDPLFLPNGTRLRMTYKGKDSFAEVRHQRIVEGDREFSASEWASKVASNTSRNAWRDIYIKRPTDDDWQLADVLRIRAKAPSSSI